MPENINCQLCGASGKPLYFEPVNGPEEPPSAMLCDRCCRSLLAMLVTTNEEFRHETRQLVKFLHDSGDYIDYE